MPRGIGGVETSDSGFDHEIIQRLGIRNKRANRLIATFDAQIAWIEIVIGHGDERLRRKRGIQSERVNRGLLTGSIAIECEHDAGTQLLPINLQRTNQLYRAQRIVGDKTTYDFGMFSTERGTACGDRSVDSGQMHGHHVGIAFDDHHLTFLDDRSLRHVNAIEHLIFAVQHRIRRIDVFRTDRIVLIQFARSEAQRTTGRIANRPCYAASKIVVHPVLALTSQSRVQHLLLRETFAGQIAH